jgi:hypothetical protein
VSCVLGSWGLGVMGLGFISGLGLGLGAGKGGSRGGSVGVVAPRGHYH